MNRKKTKKTKSKSLELQAFSKHSSELHEALNDGVMARLVWDLFAEKVFSHATCINILNVMLSVPDKATKLVSALLKVLKTDNNKFTAILNCCDRYLELKPIVNRVREECKELELQNVLPKFPSGIYIGFQ